MRPWPHLAALAGTILGQRGWSDVAIRFMDLIRDEQERLKLDDADTLIHFYNEVTDAIDRGELEQEAPPEPMWMNDFLEVVGAELLDDEQENYRVSNWHIVQGSDLAEFLEDWAAVRAQGRKDLQT